MRKRKTKNNNFLVLIGVSLLLVSTSLLVFKYYELHKTKLQEESGIEVFFEEQLIEPEEIKREDSSKKNESKQQKTDYIAVIEVPKISLKKGLVDKNNYYNNVNYNIEILRDSTMPNEKGSNLILAAHSGSSSIAYFKNLYKLENDDLVYIYFSNTVYLYEITSKYEIEKTGQAKISNGKDKKTLTMITCKSGTNKQIVVTAELVSEEGY